MGNRRADNFHENMPSRLNTGRIRAYAAIVLAFTSFNPRPGKAMRKDAALQILAKRLTDIGLGAVVVTLALVDGLDANLEQIRKGLAWHYKAYEREQTPDDRLTYAAAEKEAAAVHLGLWGDAAPMAPWEWRHPVKAAP